jgi:hypothetical protein
VTAGILTKKIVPIESGRFFNPNARSVDLDSLMTQSIISESKPERAVKVDQRS